MSSSTGSSAADNNGRGGANSSHNKGRTGFSPTDANNSSPVTSSRAKKNKQKTQGLACPIQKDDDIHGRTRSCSHGAWSDMSSIRAHLSSRRVHSVSFIRCCDFCRDHVLDEREWLTHHITRDCLGQAGKPKPQVRTPTRIAKQWLDLYTKMYPRSIGIPSPCESANLTDARQLLTFVRV